LAPSKNGFSEKPHFAVCAYLKVHKKRKGTGDDPNANVPTKTPKTNVDRMLNLSKKKC
jgi:hypothetical protein